MIDKSFNEITGSDIQRLVDERVPESRILDYKECINFKSIDEKLEFLKDLSSLANSIGGYLIYGVSEERSKEGKPTGLPKETVGVNVSEADSIIQQLESIARDGIEPRLPDLHFRAVAINSTSSVILARVGESWFKPHYVSYKASSRFFIRTSCGKMPLDFQEVKNLVIGSEELPNRIRSFRNERISKVLSGETLLPISEKSPIVVFHIVPVSSFRMKQEVDFTKFSTNLQLLPTATGMQHFCRMNLDGLARYEVGGTDSRLYGQVQLFRFGAVEFVDAFTIADSDSIPQRIVPENEIEKNLLTWMKSSFNMFKTLDIEGRCFCFLSILNVDGYRLGDTRSISLGLNFTTDRRHLFIPELEVDIADRCESAVKPLFDAFWQCFGFSQSKNFDGAGESLWKFY
ncbi:helix-turn-helix domain-containing protein [Pirellula sp. SH-Sr6A]|uniref:AlbA family DNA-binding domain-containing protein n=1 Tax=Pirellula sp. SH-Sr6A TaxID=1632865 RepID=UPI001439916D|nr:ATP-binding protein [Pirellula sp. SH-Sr6A]